MPITIPASPVALVPNTGRGTTLSFIIGGTGTTPAPGTYIFVNLISIDGPNITVGEVDATVLSSVFKPYIPTLPEGECTFTCQFITGDPALKAVRQMLAAAPMVPTVSWVVTYPLERGQLTAATDTFPGFIKGFPVTGNENETIPTVAIPIRLTGPVVSVDAV